MRACSVCGTLTANHPARGSAICSDGCRAVRKRANYRAKNYRRRTARRTLDVTKDYERELRRAASRCPMPACGVRMVDEPFLPHSKELDHMIPINVGGTHTIGNVRIICRLCNMRRPDDGSDYSGPVTLWAEEPGIAVRQRRQRQIHLCGQCSSPLENGRCYACWPRQPAKLPRPDEGRLAARLRASGLTWQAIVDATGLGGTGSAYLLAMKYGDPEDIAKWHRDDRRRRGAASSHAA